MKGNRPSSTKSGSDRSRDNLNICYNATQLAAQDIQGTDHHHIDTYLHEHIPSVPITHSDLTHHSTAHASPQFTYTNTAFSRHARHYRHPTPPMQQYSALSRLEMIREERHDTLQMPLDISRLRLHLPPLFRHRIDVVLQCPMS